jgi:hypothetical protein
VGVRLGVGEDVGEDVGEGEGDGEGEGEGVGEGEGEGAGVRIVCGGWVGMNSCAAAGVLKSWWIRMDPFASAWVLAAVAPPASNPPMVPRSPREVTVRNRHDRTI